MEEGRGDTRQGAPTKTGAAPSFDHHTAALRTPLSATFKMAVTLGIRAAVQLHMAKRADVNARDDKGQTPLIIAASKGHAEVCVMLLEAGADPVLKDDAGCDALQ